MLRLSVGNGCTRRDATPLGDLATDQLAVPARLEGVALVPGQGRDHVEAVAPLDQLHGDPRHDVAGGATSGAKCGHRTTRFTGLLGARRDGQGGPRPVGGSQGRRPRRASGSDAHRSTPWRESTVRRSGSLEQLHDRVGPGHRVERIDAAPPPHRRRRGGRRWRWPPPGSPGPSPPAPADRSPRSGTGTPPWRPSGRARRAPTPGCDRSARRRHRSRRPGRRPRDQTSSGPAPPVSTSRASGRARRHAGERGDERLVVLVGVGDGRVQHEGTASRGRGARAPLADSRSGAGPGWSTPQGTMRTARRVGSGRARRPGRQ